jgi:hypothetical protein
MVLMWTLKYITGSFDTEGACRPVLTLSFQIYLFFMQWSLVFGDIFTMVLEQNRMFIFKSISTFNMSPGYNF